MPCLYPNNETLLNMFGLTEAKVMSDVMRIIFGVTITEKTFKNWLSGEHAPKRTLPEELKRQKVSSEMQKFTQSMLDAFDKKCAADGVRPKSKMSRSVVSWDSMGTGMEMSGNMRYVAGVIGDIVKREKIFSGNRVWSKAKTKVTDDGLVNYILHADEIALMRRAKDDAHFGVSMAPLRLRTPLYVLAALEAQHVTDFNIGVLDMSRQIADGGERAVGVFFTNLSKHLVKKHVEFVRQYVVDEEGNRDEDSAGREFRRWRRGEVVPDFGTVLTIAQRIARETCAGSDICVGRIMFLFLLSVYVRNGTVKVPNWLNIKWDGEYKRFLDKHMAEIKTKAG